MKIIVTGSLGNISKPLTEKLVKQGHAVTVISSDAAKQATIEAIGAKAAIGSLEDAAFLTNTFKGADALYLMVPPNLVTDDMRGYYNRIASNYATALKQPGIKQVVYLSSIGAHATSGTGPITGAHDAEGILLKEDIDSLTILRPGFFYTNFYNYVGMIKGMGNIGTNYGGTDRLVLVAPEDIANAAFEALQQPTAGKHIRYVVSDEMTANEAATIVGEAIGKPDLQWIVFPDDAALQGMKESGMPPHAAAMFLEMGQAVRHKILWEEYDQHPEAVYKGHMKLKDFAAEFAKAF